MSLIRQGWGCHGQGADQMARCAQARGGGTEGRKGSCGLSCLTSLLERGGGCGWVLVLSMRCGAGPLPPLAPLQPQTGCRPWAREVAPLSSSFLISETGT